MPLADSLNRRYLVAGGVALSLILLLSALHTTDTYPLYTTDDRYLYGIINHSEEYASEYHDAPFDGRAFRIPDHISARIKHYIPPVTPVRESYDSDVITGPEVRDSVGRFSIPRTIYQTWKTNVVGPKMMAAVSSWIEMNPEYEYILLNDTTADAYVNSFSNPKHVLPSTYISAPASIERFAQKSFVPNGCSSEQIAPTDYMLTPEEIASVKDLYFACTVGASKADILRYMIMYEYGGVYFDVDSKCESPLREWIDADATYVTNIGLRADPAQWGLISAPGHPFMAQVLRKAITDVNSREEKCPRDAVEQVAGPPQLHGAVRQVLCNSDLGGVVDRLQIYGQDQFAGRIRFKAEGVDPEREAQGYKHWYHANDD